jgi:MutS domain V
VESVEPTYRRLLVESQARMENQRRWHIVLGYAKLADFLAGLIGAAVLIRMHGPLTLLLIPLAIFVALIVAHDRVIRRMAKIARVTDFYSRGLARLEDAWAGMGETGERFFDAAHPYARDLDLFGKGSLFELMCTARTRAGEETLARWLLSAAPPEEVRARQAAIAEIRDRVAMREQLYTAGEDVRAGGHPEELATWGDETPRLQSRWLPWVLVVLGLLWVGSLVVWALTRNWDVALLMSLINYAVSYRLQRPVSESAGALDKAAPNLKVLAEVLEIMEREPFTSERLHGLQSRLDTHHMPASKAVAKLERVYDWLEDRRNGFVAIFNPFVFYTAQFTMAAERWRSRFGRAIRGWLEAAGDFEALEALAGYAYEHPADVLPEVCAEMPCFDAEGLAHPLLPASKAVANDLQLGLSPQLIVISGPNMAGKSTFLRGVGLNAVLAQCGAPVRAKRLRMSPLTVGASICVLDSLAGGVSRFYAEIQRLKVLSDLAAGPVRLLFLLDELLSGTNSHDRYEGTRFVVQDLIGQGAVGLVTTHDLALAAIPETMNGAATNCHFEDTIEDGKLKFDYRLRPGIVQTSNALKLMEAVGLKVGSSQ